jgi:hypothetical protein
MLRTLVRYTWVAVGLVILHLAWVGAMRYYNNQEAERAAKARRMRFYRAPAEDARPGVRIVQFYAGTGEVEKGDAVLVCYGVRNATSVRIEPAVEELRPSPNRCFRVEPERTTTYRLVARGEDGSETTESFTVKVKPARPRILFVEVSHGEVRRGEPFTMCYGIVNAVAARLEPVLPKLAVGPQVCIRTFPPATLNYKLVASAADGRTDSERFTVKVRR